MGRPRVLDKRIMKRLAEKLGKEDLLPINRLVSRKASKLGISAEAALVLLAKEHDIGVSTYLRKLDSAKQAEVREALPVAIFKVGASTGRAGKRSTDLKTRPDIGKKASLKLMIEYLIEDPDLLSRCRDNLLGSTNFDIAVNQATLVLEDRIRKKAKPTEKLVGENLVGYAFKRDLQRTVLKVASNDPDDQRGFSDILRGIVPAFRNKTHHNIINDYTREEALRVCGFIDALLRVVDNSV